MSIILIFYVIICFTGTKICRGNNYFDDYISVEKSNAVKGVFVMFVFFRHYAQYVKLDGTFDTVFCLVDHWLGQMIVTLFLFYSGYGILKSIERKGGSYVREIPARRACKVWVHFIIAILLFLITRLAMGRHTSVRRLLLSFLGWESIGNSSWYILAVVLCYLFTYAAFMLIPKNRKLAAAGQTVLTVIAVLILMQVRPGRYYNTLLCFSAGMWYALYRDRIEAFLINRRNYILTLFLTALVCLAANWQRNSNVWVYETAAVTFAGTVVLLTMKVGIHNRFLQYMGNHVFSLYILQRLPMMYLSGMTKLADSPYLFFGITLFLTVVISYLFDRCMTLFDRVVFDRRR